MRFTRCCLSLLIALVAAVSAVAQSDPFDTLPQPTPPSRTTIPTSPQPPTPSVAPAIDQPLKLVSLTILLVEAPASKLPDNKTPEELLTLIEKLASANELTGHTRLQLSTADGQQGFVQNGEQVSVPQASTRIDARVVQRSVTRQSVGTTVRCTPRVVEGDKIVATLEIEESRLVPVARPMGAPEEPAIELPPSVQNSVARTVVTIPSGRTLLVGGQQTTTPDGKSRQSLILVTAKVSE